MTILEFRKRLYCNKVEEVRQRVATRDPYDLIMATGLIRHLLMEEGQSLALRASRDLRHKLSFTVRQYVPFPFVGGKIWHLLPIIYHLEPEDGANAPEIVSRRKPFARPSLLFLDHEYSVGDLLDICANIRGGIHIKMPTEKEDAIDWIDRHLRFGDQTLTMAMLVEIINVILKGLEPLTAAIVAQLRQKGAGAHQESK